MKPGLKKYYFIVTMTIMILCLKQILKIPVKKKGQGINDSMLSKSIKFLMIPMKEDKVVHKKNASVKRRLSITGIYYSINYCQILSILYASCHQARKERYRQ